MYWRENLIALSRCGASAFRSGESSQAFTFSTLGHSPSESRLSPQSSVSPMIAVGNGHLLLYGNTLVASVRRQGTSSRSLNCRAAEDQRPFLPQAHLAPLRRGLFLRSWPPGG